MKHKVIRHFWLYQSRRSPEDTGSKPSTLLSFGKFQDANCPNMETAVRETAEEYLQKSMNDHKYRYQRVGKKNAKK